MAAAVIVLSVLVVTPVAALIYGSLSTVGLIGQTGGGFTLDNYITVITDPETYTLFLNSLTYAFGASIISLFLGFLLSWIVFRTNTPFRRLFEVISIVPYIIPGILYIISWMFLLSPHMGIINKFLMSLFNLGSAPFDVKTLGGMIFVSGLSGTPICFMIMGAAMQSMDPSLEEAAKVSGSGTLNLLRSVIFPILKPAVLSAFFLALFRLLENFQAPALLGMPRFFVFTTKIYRLTAIYPPN
ncbi:MAG: ABC transporter permease, partial [Candidatus Hodarchaeota archaeon]